MREGGREGGADPIQISIVPEWLYMGLQYTPPLLSRQGPPVHAYSYVLGHYTVCIHICMKVLCVLHTYIHTYGVTFDGTFLKLTNFGEK